MIPETCPDHIPLKSLCCYFCPTKAQIRTYLTVLLQFLSNHPETFRICSRDHLETSDLAEF